METVLRTMFDPEIRAWTEDFRQAGSCQACHLQRGRVVVIQINNTLLRFCYSCLKRIKDTTNFQELSSVSHRMLTAKLLSIETDVWFKRHRIKCFIFKCPRCFHSLTWTIPEDQIFTGGLLQGTLCHNCDHWCRVRATLEIRCQELNRLLGTQFLGKQRSVAKIYGEMAVLLSRLWSHLCSGKRSPVLFLLQTMWTDSL